MMLQTFLLGLVSLAVPLCSAGYPFYPQPDRPGRWVTPSVGAIWPRPQQQVLHDDAFEIDPNNFRIQFGSEHGEQSCGILLKGAERIKERMFKSTPSKRVDTSKQLPLSHGSVTVLHVNLYSDSGDCDKLYPSTESKLKAAMESYTISVDTQLNVGQANIKADTPWGALRGLESFSHMVYSFRQQSVDHYYINRTQVADFPKLPYRGLMLDTARHFLPKSTIMQVLELMEMNKFNVFHWHLVDTQSFPYESIKFPELSAKAAWSDKHVYSQGDVAEIIEAARIRGIRVVPEFDTPGHSESWGVAHPEILTKCGTPPPGKPALPILGPMNPIKNKTYEFVSEFFEEISKVFPDQYVHLGGDEVELNCWQNNKEISDYAKANNITDFKKLQAMYFERLIPHVTGFNRTPIAWQDVFDGGNLTPGLIAHLWTGEWKQELRKVTAKGHRAIVSSPWYLNLIHYGVDWTNYYKVELTDFGGTPEQQALVEGGEVCLWSEYINKNNLIPRGFPRASTVAEKLWSSKEVTDLNDAAARLEEHACRMHGRGYKVKPATGPGFC